MMPYYKNIEDYTGKLPIAENYYTKCLSIPMYPTLSDEEQEFVINTIKSHSR
jgi:dTDP-4-amino-4,6-dideoxygalactose transaminase